MSDEVIWKGRPSQWVNLLPLVLVSLFVIGGIVGAFLWSVWFLLLGVVGLLWGLWKYLEVRVRVYELTVERLRIYEGVLNQSIDELELYRVKDMTMERPIWLRLVGLSTLVLVTSDRTHPELRIEAVRGAVELRDRLRVLVEGLRDRKRVREMDFSSDGEAAEFEDFEM